MVGGGRGADHRPLVDGHGPVPRCLARAGVGDHRQQLRLSHGLPGSDPRPPATVHRKHPDRRVAGDDRADPGKGLATVASLERGAVRQYRRYAAVRLGGAASADIQ